jgi:biotin carboxyl carrier protein
MEDIEKKNEQEEKECSKYQVINIDNIKYRTTIPQKYQKKKPYKPKKNNEIYAFIPGTIQKIYVKKNDKVKKGDKLLVLTAMKMNNEVLSPIDGTVEDVFVKENDSVGKSQMLIKLT